MCVSQRQVRRAPMMDIFREQRDLGFRHTKLPLQIPLPGM